MKEDQHIAADVERLRVFKGQSIIHVEYLLVAEALGELEPSLSTLEGEFEQSIFHVEYLLVVEALGKLADTAVVVRG